MTLKINVLHIKFISRPGTIWLNVTPRLIAGFCFIYYYWIYLISLLIFHHNTISRIQYQKQQTIEDKTWLLDIAKSFPWMPSKGLISLLQAIQHIKEIIPSITRSNPYKCTQGPYECFSLLIQLINVNTKERR